MMAMKKLRLKASTSPQPISQFITHLTCPGVFCYNRAKQCENQAAVSLPLSMPTKAPVQQPIWQNHVTFESKVRVAAPLHIFDSGDLKRNQ
jgi:hypothetical protein